MKFAADFRQIARDSLRGNWGVAVLTGFVASLIGATTNSGDGSNFDSDSSAISEQLQPFLPAILAVLTVSLIVSLVIGGAGKLGYATFNLHLVDRKPVAFSDLFSQFHRLGEGFCMKFFMGLYTILWSLLFIIPGVVKTYSYAMTPYILAENPNITANEAITKSRLMMHGNKWRLFCLQFSFIGWGLLCSLPAILFLPMVYAGTFGTVTWLAVAFVAVVIGNLFLTPYTEAAHAAFYREISNT